MKSNIVTLIAPFYNAEDYLERFLISLLGQTYINVQVILVNDGSDDNSDDVVKRYTDKLKDKFYEFIYLKKNNGGAASAINFALKYVEGEYLCWADCDDELLPDNIYLKWKFLSENLDYGLVNCGAVAVNQITGEEIEKLIIPDNEKKDNMFMRIISGIPAYTGVFMIRTKLLFDKLDDREIYYNREAGQNYQLLLPVAYDSKCGFIDNVLYKYYIRMDSHSHNVDYCKIYNRTFVREELLDNVLNFMNTNDKDNIMRVIKKESCKQRFNLAFVENDRENANKSYMELKKFSISYKEILKHLIINVGVLNNLYRLRGER